MGYVRYYEFPNVSQKCQIVLAWLGLILFSWNGVGFAALSQAQVQEYEVKAMFLFYFSKFIDYPESILNPRTPALQICIFGEDPFESAIDIAVQGKEAHGHSIEIKRLNDINTAKGCHILFVSPSERNVLPQVFSYTRQYPILTVSDTEGFIESGGMIQFYIADNKVRFMIDLKKIQGVNLKVSSRLLQVAQVIK
jgi:hypothetical protein